MMARQQLLELIGGIQQRLPRVLLEGAGFEWLEARRLDRWLADSLACFPPLFLPILRRNTDLIALHLEPGVPWQARPWMLLPHDEDEPRFIASSLMTLAGGLRLNYYYSTGLQAPLDELARHLTGEGLPSIGPFDDARAISPQVRLLVDPGNGAAVLDALSLAGLSALEAFQRLRSLPERHWQDPLINAALAVVGHEAGQPDAAPRARDCLRRELPLMRADIWEHGSGTRFRLFELLRSVAAGGVASDDPLTSILGMPLKGQRAVAAMVDLSQAYVHRGELHHGLAVLRTASHLHGLAQAGEFGRVWCGRLASLAERIEPGGASAALACLAEEVTPYAD